MEVKEADEAPRRLSPISADERILHVGLEEVKFNEQGGIWEITIGFYRPWIETLRFPFDLDERSYKTVRIKDEDAKSYR